MSEPEILEAWVQVSHPSKPMVREPVKCVRKSDYDALSEQLAEAQRELSKAVSANAVVVTELIKARELAELLLMERTEEAARVCDAYSKDKNNKCDSGAFSCRAPLSTAAELADKIRALPGAKGG